MYFRNRKTRMRKSRSLTEVCLLNDRMRLTPGVEIFSEAGRFFFRRHFFHGRFLFMKIDSRDSKNLKGKFAVRDDFVHTIDILKKCCYTDFNPKIVNERSWRFPGSVFRCDDPIRRKPKIFGRRNRVRCPAVALLWWVRLQMPDARQNRCDPRSDPVSFTDSGTFGSALPNRDERIKL